MSYEPEINYKQITDAAECINGVLEGVNCAVCDKLFVALGRLTVSTCRVGPKTPVWICKNYIKYNCKWALCNRCFVENMTRHQSERGRARSAQQQKKKLKS